MTDYDPKPTAVHQQERYDDNDGSGIAKWLIPLLVLAAILAALFWFFQPRADIDVDLPEVSGGDISGDMSVNPVDVDIDMPKVRVEGGDVDVDRTGRTDVDVPDVDVDVEGGDIDMPEVDVDVEDDE